MWKDSNDKIDELFLKLQELKEFPTICPICNKKNAHIYMHVYNNKTRRGGSWSWCSECHSFSHSTMYVPEYWRNCSEIELEKLSAVPIYLEEIKDKLDKHANAIMMNLL